VNADREISRRHALGWAGGVAAAGALAACTSGDERPPAPTTSTDSAAGLSSAGSSAAAGPDWAALSAKLSRPLVRPGAAGFAASWQLYNPRFDGASPPAAVARAGSSADVAACVRFAADAGVPLALRAGGHSYGGWSTGTGLVVDTRGLASVQVDNGAGLARIGAGASLAAVYSALGGQGVAIAGGSCPTVGLTGLALGGGVGVLTRNYGLTCDAIRSVELVTADGKIRTVDGAHGTDLFWAVRGGGGGSFGAVTALTLAVRPAPTITTFFFEFPFGQAVEVVTAWFGWIAGQPNQLWSTCKLLGDPADNSLHATVSGTWTGSAGGLNAQLAPLLAQLPAPTSRSIGTDGYTDVMFAEAGCAGQSLAQCTTAALTPPKRQPFAATSSIVSTPPPAAAIAAAAGQVRNALAVPGLVEGGVSFDALGGAVAGVAPDATAFVHRRALASVQYTATWGATAPAGPTAAAPFDTYVRGFRSTMTPFFGPSAYVNYADPSIADYGSAYWGANYPRLQQVKRTYDPHQLFRFPQSVQP
jgi:hypothetical protein